MKTLSRPMFKRGGGVSSNNNGIVSGFSNGGAAERTQAMIEEMERRGLLDQPTAQKGLTASDYLRIAAAGAQIMGAQPTGRSGFIGALQAASPALSSLGTDLAATSDVRAQNLLAQQEARQQRISDAITTGFDYDKDEFQRVLDSVASATDTILDPGSDLREKEIAFQSYKTALLGYVGEDLGEFDRITETENVQKDPAFQNATTEQIQDEVDRRLLKSKLVGYSRELNVLFDAMERAREAQQSAEGGRVGMDKGGKVMMAMSDPSPAAERFDMLEDMALKRFGKPLSSLTDVQVIELEEDLEELIREKMSEGGSTRAGSNEEKAAEDRMKMESDKFFIDEDGNLKKIPKKRPRQKTRAGMNEEAAFDAARRKELNPQGRAEGGAMTTGSKDSPLTFEELRARLPREVTDQVVRLLATSEAALLDFANIDTEQDIAIFNQKYNADLQLPTQVA
tara:strand:- start:3079 stop:4437 length:1359 start_codon:yes stop_codon:yes gene_type:complete